MKFKLKETLTLLFFKFNTLKLLALTKKSIVQYKVVAYVIK